MNSPCAEIQSNEEGSGGVDFEGNFVQRAPPSSPVPSRSFGGTEVRSCEIAGHRVQITYTIEGAKVDDWISTHASSNTLRLWGFDCEWRVDFSRSPGLPRGLPDVVQLATPTAVLVAHLAHMVSERSRLPEQLVALMSDPAALLVGVAATEDAKMFTQYLSISRGTPSSEAAVQAPSMPASVHATGSKSSKDPEAVFARALAKATISVPGRARVIELQSLAQSAKLGRSIGLQTLGVSFLGTHRWKSRSLSLSNWRECPLRDAQIDYAAIDAWTGRMAFDALRDFIIQGAHHPATSSVSESHPEFHELLHLLTYDPVMLPTLPPLPNNAFGPGAGTSLAAYVHAKHRLRPLRFWQRHAVRWRPGATWEELGITGPVRFMPDGAHLAIRNLAVSGLL
jgi:hypothetical protein